MHMRRGNLAGGRVTIVMATAPLPPHFWTCGDPHGPDEMAPQAGCTRAIRELF